MKVNALIERLQIERMAAQEKDVEVYLIAIRPLVKRDFQVKAIKPYKDDLLVTDHGVSANADCIVISSVD